MNGITPCKIKTGSDPRTLPNYAALRDELNKLTHPARPDVNWGYVEKLCLSLFEQNGVELQTVAWYTLARTQRAGLLGMNEGLTILETLISHQWSSLWPQPVHARMKILSSLSRRLQQRIRTLSLKDCEPSQLYRSELLLSRLGEELQRLEPIRPCQFDTLLFWVQHNVARLEDGDGQSASDTVETPSDMLQPALNDRADSVQRLIIPEPVHQPDRDVLTVMPTPLNRWTFFVLGMGAMLAISAATVCGWWVAHRPDSIQKQLTRPAAPLPEILTPVQRDALRQQAPQTSIAEIQQ